MYLLGVGQRENTERNKISEKVMAKDKERQLFQIGTVFRFLSIFGSPYNLGIDRENTISERHFPILMKTRF